MPNKSNIVGAILIIDDKKIKTTATIHPESRINGWLKYADTPEGTQRIKIPIDISKTLIAVETNKSKSVIKSISKNSAAK